MIKDVRATRSRIQDFREPTFQLSLVQSDEFDEINLWSNRQSDLYTRPLPGNSTAVNGLLPLKINSKFHHG